MHLPRSVKPSPDHDIAVARKIARVLDHDLVDPMLGLLLPGIGDVLGSVIGLYIVAVAARRRLSPVVLARMLLTLGVDVVLGIIPVLGDITDFFIKANERNMKLLDERAASGGRARWTDWLVLACAAIAFFGVIVLVCWAVAALLRRL
jgi:hypothetical protein